MLESSICSNAADSGDVLWKMDVASFDGWNCTSLLCSWMCTEDGWNPAAGTVGCKAIDRNRVTAAGYVVMVSIGWALADGRVSEPNRCDIPRRN